MIDDTKRRGQREMVLAGGAACWARQRETGEGSVGGVADKARGSVGWTGGKTVGSGGGWSRTQQATSETVDVSRRPMGVRYWRQGCHPGERRGLGVRLPVCSWRKTGEAPPTTVHRPRSGSTKARAIRSRPSKAGEGREAMGSGRGSSSEVTSSKRKRGSGKWSRVLEIEMRVAPVFDMKHT